MAEDVSEAARQITVPVPGLAAEKDVVEPIARVRLEVCDRIPEARMEVILRSGHFFTPRRLRGYCTAYTPVHSNINRQRPNLAVSRAIWIAKDTSVSPPTVVVAR